MLVKVTIFGAKTERMKLDPIDIEILNELLKNSRLSVRELAARVHRSPTPVFERLKRLESSGVIRAYTLSLDLDKAGRGFTVLCNVKLRHINSEIHELFAKEVERMPQVTECYNVSGVYDYLLKVQVPDMESYRRFVTDTLGHLEMLESVQSVFVMQTIKHASACL